MTQNWVLEGFESAEEEESGPPEEGETKEGEKGARSEEERERERGNERRERGAFSCISFLDSCLLDDRIKEYFNMTSVIYFDINMPRTPPPGKVTPCTSRAM